MAGAPATVIPAVVLFTSVLRLATAEAVEVVETALFKGSFLLASSAVDTNGNEFLSADEAGRTYIGCVSKDYDTGRQRWKLLFGGADWYNIVASVGTPSSFDFLGFNDSLQDSGSVQMFATDDGSGRQRWQLVRLNMSEHLYQIRPMGNHSHLWLSHAGTANGASSISLSRSHGPEVEWTILEFAGEYNLVNGASFLSATAVSGLVSSVNANDGSGRQRWQFLKQIDGVFKIIIVGVQGPASELKYLAVSSQGPKQEDVVLNNRSGHIHWAVSAKPDGTFTLQNVESKLWLTMPHTAGSTSFLSPNFSNDGNDNWSLFAEDKKPIGVNCISTQGSNLYLRGPLGSTWNLVKGPAAEWFNIITTGSTYSSLYLSFQASTNAVVLVTSDDGTGQERWEINEGPGNASGYFIQPWAPDSVKARYLSVNSNVRNSSLDLVVVPVPAGANQVFVIGACPQQHGSTNSPGMATALAIILGILGAVVVFGGLAWGYYRNQKPAGDSPNSPIPRSFLVDVEAVQVGKAFEDLDDVKIEIPEPAPEVAPRMPTRQGQGCWFFNCLLPCQGLSVGALP